MELNFPSPATTGTVYTGTNSVTYIYDGLKWSGQIPVQSDLDTGLIHYYDDQIEARPTGDVVIATDSGNWTFGSTGTLTFADGSVQNTAYTGTVAYSNITNIPTFTTSTLYNSTSSFTLNSNGSVTFSDSSIQQTAWTGTVSYSNVTNIPTFTTATLYNGTATFSVSNSGTVTLFHGATLRDTVQHAVAFGQQAGTTNQGISSVAIGYGAGSTSQGGEAVAVGEYAGQNSQGQYAVAIGSYAGRNNQPSGSIIINATGSELNTTTSSSFYVKPVRSVSTTTGLSQVWYNVTTGEVVTSALAVVNRTTGSWTLATGVNTVSITVPLNGNYTMWVNGNIPNGIVNWNATVNVSNPNVPAIGSQYAWYYYVGNALVLTSIPNQIVGTAGVISTSSSYVGSTANVFTFGITNNSTSSQVINWGYTTL